MKQHWWQTSPLLQHTCTTLPPQDYMPRAKAFSSYHKFLIECSETIWKL